MHRSLGLTLGEDGCLDSQTRMRTASMLFCLVILLLVLGKGVQSLLVLGVLGEVFFLGCSETPAIGGDIWKGRGVGSSKVVISGPSSKATHSRVYLQG